MPYRALMITSRRHPIAIGSYLSISILAVLYIINVANSDAMLLTAGPIATKFWEVLLLIGGITSLSGILLPYKKLLTGLGIEALGSFIIGMELGAYCGVMGFTLSTIPWATLLVFSATAICCLARTYTALNDRKRVIKATQDVHLATQTPLGEAE